MGDDNPSNFEFTRELEIETAGVDLKLIQYSLCDVSSVVWDAGIVLGKFLDFMQKTKDVLSDKIVIDIGSGTGVAGLFAAVLGAEVILTDLPKVIPLLEKNIELNKNIIKGAATASVLDWGNLDKKFPVPDIILVSDCIYYDMSVEKLIPTLVDLSDAHTEIYISYEDRDLGNKKELLKNFLHVSTKHFTIEPVSKNSYHPDFQSHDIHILKFKKIAMQNENR